MDLFLDQKIFQQTTVCVVADDAQNGGLAVKVGNVSGNVGGTAGPVFCVGDTYHRHRCFR